MSCCTNILAHIVAGILRFVHWVRHLCCCCCPYTSHAEGLMAQEKVLRHFLRRSNFQIKSTPLHGINYVTIQRTDRDLRPEAQRRTLFLVHGYAMGLGFFLSKYCEMNSWT